MPVFRSDPLCCLLQGGGLFAGMPVLSMCAPIPDSAGCEYTLGACVCSASHHPTSPCWWPRPCGALVSASSVQADEPAVCTHAYVCHWVPPHPCLLKYFHPVTRHCLDVCSAAHAHLCAPARSPAHVSMRVPGSPHACMPPVVKGQLASSQVTLCHEDPWVSQSSLRLAAVKEPFVVLLCTPLPQGSQPSGSPHSRHGRMSSSLGGIWSLSSMNRHL